jgi:carbonic anhydrase
MLTFSNDQLHSQVKRELGADSDAIDFLPFSDLDGSVAEDVRLLAASPLLEPGTPVRGFVYDVASGALREVSVAQEVAATR